MSGEERRLDACQPDGHDCGQLGAKGCDKQQRSRVAAARDVFRNGKLVCACGMGAGANEPSSPNHSRRAPRSSRSSGTGTGGLFCHTPQPGSVCAPVAQPCFVPAWYLCRCDPRTASALPHVLTYTRSPSPPPTHLLRLSITLLSFHDLSPAVAVVVALDTCLLKTTFVPLVPLPAHFPPRHAPSHSLLHPGTGHRRHRRGRPRCGGQPHRSPVRGLDRAQSPVGCFWLRQDCERCLGTGCHRRDCSCWLPHGRRPLQ